MLDIGSLIHFIGGLAIFIFAELYRQVFERSNYKMARLGGS